MTRIISGSAGGHRLQTPKGAQTRPTTDRTKEALFNAVANWFGALGESTDQQLAGLAVLDLYAGTGSIALEAASRGAAKVVAVESDRVAAGVISANVKATNLAVQVRNLKVETYLLNKPELFSFVFLDPPYEVVNTTIESHLTRLNTGWLAQDALVVVERSKRDQPFEWPAGFADSWLRRYGETTLYFAICNPRED